MYGQRPYISRFAAGNSPLRRPAGGHALLADFGVARAVSEAVGLRKATTVGVALGTPEYMAPEQAGADPATDHRADLFTAGVIPWQAGQATL
jgi:serine/threonine protein kinase